MVASSITMIATPSSRYFFIARVSARPGEAMRSMVAAPFIDGHAQTPPLSHGPVRPRRDPDRLDRAHPQLGAPRVREARACVAVRRRMARRRRDPAVHDVRTLRP